MLISSLRQKHEFQSTRTDRQIFKKPVINLSQSNEIRQPNCLLPPGNSSNSRVRPHPRARGAFAVLKGCGRRCNGEDIIKIIYARDTGYKRKLANLACKIRRRFVFVYFVIVYSDIRLRRGTTATKRNDCDEVKVTIEVVVKHGTISSS